MKISRLATMFFMLIIAGSFLTGCLASSNSYRSSVVTYLYPYDKEPVETPEVPLLSLPLKVGIAFVPESSEPVKGLTEKDKMDLMKEVSNHFKAQDFVKSIDLIPSAYLTPEGSFANLDQIRTMFGIDVIVLLSFDQTQFTDEGIASIAYWTLIGAYIIPGEKNDTHTMLDAAVYDIKTRKMLFRAPGISHIKSNATPVNLSEKKRIDSAEGFRESSKDLVINLDEQLQVFKEKIKESPEDYRIVHKPGFTGGGSLDGFYLILLAVMGMGRLWSLKFRNS